MDKISLASNLANNLSLWLALIIGIVASTLVLTVSKKMGGGLFGSVLKYIGVGMVFVVVGTLSVLLSTWIPAAWVSLIHTVLFSLGFIFMVLGANKLYGGIMS